MDAECQSETVALPQDVLESAQRTLAQLVDLLGLARDSAHSGGPAAPATGARSQSAQLRLPTVAEVKNLIRLRQLRESFFGRDLVSDPGWGILLELLLARLEYRHICVTSACIGSGAPSTTALRYLQGLEERRMIYRYADPLDRRRTFVALTDEALKTVARMFAMRDAKAM